MKVILIEDEAIALRKLKKIILDIDPGTVIAAELESVYDAKNWFQQNSSSAIDLIFSDIQLSDGLSFEIFDSLNTQLPIIFTTAYNEYALRAFKLNGVDYLLKPIQKEEVQKALAKFAQTRTIYSQNQLLHLQQLIHQFKQPGRISPTFISYVKDKMIPFAAESVAYFYTSNQLVYAVTEQREFVMNENLKRLKTYYLTTYFFGQTVSLLSRKNLSTMLNSISIIGWWFTCSLKHQKKL